LVSKYEKWTEEEITHYINIHKKHENEKASTVARTEYWKKYYENK